MQLTRAHLVVKGRVQGVFYRAFARDISVQLGLRGWVRNLSDGSVEVSGRVAHGKLDICNR